MLSGRTLRHRTQYALYAAACNQVERWFAYVTEELIRRGSHTSVQALEADIRGWITGWNADPKPFIWTKTAEQILDSLGRLLTRTSGAGHQSCTASTEGISALTRPILALRRHH